MHEVTKPEGRAHRFDEDAVCKICGFDGAEWAHWKRSTFEGQASDTKRPLCTQPGLDRDTHDEPDL